MRDRKVYYLLLLLCLPVVAFSQIKQYGPARKAPEKVAPSINAKRHAVNPVALPFWDDFSFAKGTHADSLLWIDNDKVFVNDGQAINPPSINVATFDGYNASGRPYSSVALETGYGDTLESQPILLGDVPVQYRDSIYLSFFYQAGGNSEMPNPSDFLKLEFKSTTGWVEIHRFTIKSNADRSAFYDTAIQITTASLPGEREYFHNQFQFRFTSFGRLSGSYDAWHLDYVYLNRRVSDNSLTEHVVEFDINTNISDRTTTRPFTSLFGEYFSIPNKHFDPTESLEAPRVSLYSLKYVDFPQVVTYTATYTVTSFNSGTPLITYNQSPDNGETSFEPIDQPTFDGIPVLEHITVKTKSAVPSSFIDPESDSTKITVKIAINAGDNGGKANDYYPRYEPISFLLNDTLRHTFTLSNYYAYDDGVAEYSAALAAQGNQFAYRFVMDSGVGKDTLNGVYFYFPFAGGTVPESVRIFVFEDDAGKPDSAFTYSLTVPVTRSDNNLFTEIDFTEGVIVKDTFYIGYEETITGKSDRIRIGLDASHDTGNQMYYRNTVYHPWIQNTDLKGSLMIRPRFGPATVITGTEDKIERAAIYPNPNRGEFYIKGRAENIQVISLTGQSIGFYSEQTGEEKKIILQNVHPGIYVIRYRIGSKVLTGKILVTGN